MSALHVGMQLIRDPFRCDVDDDVSNLFRNIIAMESHNESSDEEKLFIKVLEDRMQNLMEEKNQTLFEAVEIRMQEILDEKAKSTSY